MFVRALEGNSKKEQSRIQSAKIQPRQTISRKVNRAISRQATLKQQANTANTDLQGIQNQEYQNVYENKEIDSSILVNVRCGQNEDEQNVSYVINQPIEQTQLEQSIVDPSQVLKKTLDQQSNCFKPNYSKNSLMKRYQSHHRQYLIQEQSNKANNNQDQIGTNLIKTSKIKKSKKAKNKIKNNDFIIKNTLSLQNSKVIVQNQKQNEVQEANPYQIQIRSNEQILKKQSVFKNLSQESQKYLNAEQQVSEDSNLLKLKQNSIKMNQTSSKISQQQFSPANTDQAYYEDLTPLQPRNIHQSKQGMSSMNSHNEQSVKSSKFNNSYKELSSGHQLRHKKVKLQTHNEYDFNTMKVSEKINKERDISKLSIQVSQNLSPHYGNITSEYLSAKHKKQIKDNIEPSLEQVMSRSIEVIISRSSRNSNHNTVGSGYLENLSITDNKYHQYPKTLSNKNNQKRVILNKNVKNFTQLRQNSKFKKQNQDQISLQDQSNNSFNYSESQNKEYEIMITQQRRASSIDNLDTLTQDSPLKFKERYVENKDDLKQNRSQEQQMSKHEQNKTSIALTPICMPIYLHQRDSVAEQIADTQNKEIQIQTLPSSFEENELSQSNIQLQQSLNQVLFKQRYSLQQTYKGNKLLNQRDFDNQQHQNIELQIGGTTIQTIHQRITQQIIQEIQYQYNQQQVQQKLNDDQKQIEFLEQQEKKVLSLKSLGSRQNSDLLVMSQSGQFQNYFRSLRHKYSGQWKIDIEGQANKDNKLDQLQNMNDKKITNRKQTDINIESNNNKMQDISRLKLNKLQRSLTQQDFKEIKQESECHNVVKDNQSSILSPSNQIRNLNMNQSYQNQHQQSESITLEKSIQKSKRSTIKESERSLNQSNKPLTIQSQTIRPTSCKGYQSSKLQSNKRSKLMESIGVHMQSVGQKSYNNLGLFSKNKQNNDPNIQRPLSNKLQLNSFSNRQSQPENKQQYYQQQHPQSYKQIKKNVKFGLEYYESNNLEYFNEQQHYGQPVFSQDSGKNKNILLMKTTRLTQRMMNHKPKTLISNLQKQRQRILIQTSDQFSNTNPYNVLQSPNSSINNQTMTKNYSNQQSRLHNLMSPNLNKTVSNQRQNIRQRPQTAYFRK